MNKQSFDSAEGFPVVTTTEPLIISLTVTANWFRIMLECIEWYRKPGYDWNFHL